VLVLRSSVASWTTVAEVWASVRMILFACSCFLDIFSWLRLDFERVTWPVSHHARTLRLAVLWTVYIVFAIRRVEPSASRPGCPGWLPGWVFPESSFVDVVIAAPITVADQLFGSSFDVSQSASYLRPAPTQRRSSVIVALILLLGGVEPNPGPTAYSTAVHLKQRNPRPSLGPTGRMLKLLFRRTKNSTHPRLSQR